VAESVALITKNGLSVELYEQSLAYARGGAQIEGQTSAVSTLWCATWFAVV